MELKIHLGKLKCACCCKIIPNGRVMLYDKPIGDLYEVKINHLCLPCFTYTTNIRKIEQVNQILRTIIYDK